MFEIINESGNTIDNIDVLYEFIDYLVLKENLDDAIFNIIFIDNKKIQEINKQYRHIDAPTDVISFALEDTEDCCISEYRVLGDIYISLDKAKEQAIYYNHSLKREICFLAVHGLLHLLGYDHQTKEDEQIMFKKQEDYLNDYGIER
ncbi:MAG: rRNA maturation RNase YbeY [Bacilli bacterium]